MTHEEVLVDVMTTHIQMMRNAVKLAVEKSPADAVSMIAEYFEEAGVRHECAETRELLDAWWGRWIEIRKCAKTMHRLLPSEE